MSQRPLQILLLNSCRKWIGEAAHCFDLYRQLERRGHGVTLGCRKGRALEQAARQEGIQPLSLHFNSRFSPALDGADLRAVRRVIRQRKIDVIHCHRGKDHWLAATAKTLYARTTPLIRTRHVVTPARNHWLNRWLYARATDAMISVSDRVQDSMGPLRDSLAGDSRGDRAHVIRSAVDLERFCPGRREPALRAALGVGEDELLVGLIGRFQNIKGQHVFIDAAAQVLKAHPKAKFLLTGRAAKHKTRRYREQAAALGIADRVIILGYQDDLAALLASLDLGVCASLGSEGSSRVTLEYLASGAPVVATQVGGIPELLDRGRHGLLAEPGDAKDLAAKMGELLGDPQRRADLSREGRAYVERQHNYDRWTREIEAVYRQATTVVSRD